MRARTLAALMAVLLFAWPVAAQEQRGSIEGVVKDSSGAVLPGVSVEAKTNTGVVLTTTTNTEGVYRFPSVSPGNYEITASLQGFAPRKQADVAVNLGQVKKVDLALGLSGVTESVQVTAESPLVDVRQSARQTNIRAEQIDLLPKGRDFTSLVTQAAGANNESKLGGISIDGASGGENRYIIDGIETTNLQSGTSGKNVIADFIEEVQVKSSGYTAEFGGATGGVINVLMKSGSNDWRGSALFNWEGDKLQTESRPTLRLKLADVTQSEYITYPKDSRSRMEPGFSLGGPIMRNRAWFFGAYQPALTTIERSVSPTTSGNPSGIAQTREQKESVQYATANLTSQLTDTLRGRVSYNNSWSKTEGLLPGLTATDATTLNFDKATTRPNYSVSGHLDWVATPNLFFGIRGGHYFSDVFDTNVPEEPLIRWLSTNNVGLAGVPADLQRPTGFRSITSNSKSIRDQQTRTYGQVDGTVYAKLGGDHQVKFGVQADRVGNNVLTGESRNVVSLSWNESYGGLRGPFGYYTVRSNGAEPRTGFVTEGDIHTTNIGLFIQDAWTINNKLTVNAGIRTEREKVPAYAIGDDIPEFALEFGFKDKFAPRVGFAYDVNGDGKWKAFGSWGVFYDIFKLELPRGSFGGDKWYDYVFSLDTPNWPTLMDSPNCPPACPGTNITGGVGFVDFRHPSFGADAIEPDLKPMRQQEATFGLEHQLNDRVALSLRYVHKQVDRAIEDTGFIDADGHEGYVIANPGEGITSIAFPGVALPKAKRDYDSVEFLLEKRFASNWYLRSSYLWSRLYGNYSGLSQSDENGRTSPNVGRLFDHPTMMFGQDGRPVFGPLATDRPHQFKSQFIYQFPMGTSLGVNQFVASGIPVSREIGVITGHAYPLQYLGRGSDGRTPMFSQTDLSLQHQFRIGGTRAVSLTLNVLNLFNQDTVTSKHSTQQRTGALNITENGLYAGTLNFDQLAKAQAPNGISLDPRFLQANGYQAPLQARVGVRFSF